MCSQPAKAPPASAQPRSANDVDVVVVAYNSGDHLRATVEPLVGLPNVHVIVVDNASPEGGLETLADLPVTAVSLSENRGFSAGCNAGWRRGRAPYVLFLNPDARIDGSSLRALVDVLERDAEVGLVAPKIVDSGGDPEYSQRRFRGLRSAYARAFFLHRLFPGARWADDTVRDPRAYETSTTCDWVSGACMLVRRDVLATVGGLDERFFLYCEDEDLCQSVWSAGYRVQFEPAARCMHDGGASAPRPSLFAVDARSRLLYARKHAPTYAVVALEWLALVANALTHSFVSKGGSASRAGHIRALATLIGASRGEHRRA
jgi:N-acetylglucosaminyl-diphospho-decaprenol L-rhamnosyltransferase